jgi:hypothetical protein
MATTSSMDLVALVREHLEEAHPDVLRSLIATFVEALMGAEVDAICGADYRHPSPERTNRRNGYRQRPWDTRVGTIELGIGKLRQGTYFPDWLQERSRSLGGSPHQRDRHLLACSGSGGDASRSWLGPLESRSCRSPRSRKMAHSLRRRGPSLSYPSPRRPAPTRSS